MTHFALTIFLGAFLLFQVQPMMAKFLLPWFGGGTGVWTTCMLFFQACLLAGYLYAHLLTRFCSKRAQALAHLALLLAALVMLPIIPGPRWQPASDGNPIWQILLLLTACLGLPYFALAATAPLLQAWFNRLHPGVVPYRLYALSNAASLLALGSYPFVVEPLLTRRTQALMWAWSFAAFGLLCGGCAVRFWRSSSPDAPLKQKGGTLPTQSAQPSVPSAIVKAWWFGLAACGSVLLLATTNKVCLDIASVPFLWVLPLSLYLLTFVICFDRPAWYDRKVFGLLLVPLLVLLCFTLAQGSNQPLWLQVVAYGNCLFVGCMVCHGEVYRLRPSARFLTSFYLFIAAGGAAGGAFVALFSPLVFRSYAELNWGFWLLAALVLSIHFHERTQIQWRRRSWRLWPVVLVGTVTLGGVLLLLDHNAARDTVSVTRNFYGVQRVVEIAPGNPFHAYKLMHGGITHGMQLVDPSLSGLATTYYHESSGVGLAVNNFIRQTNRSLGLVGLGIGTLAAYGRHGDTLRFYEIDPNVVKLADRKFTFLRNCACRVEVIQGDARLSLERETPREFDLLVLDAFTSDAIPVHLLTKEAFKTYFRHLKPDGAILVNISNRHLDLLRVLAGVGKEFRLMMVSISWRDETAPWWFAESQWVILSHNQPFLLSQPIMSHATSMPEWYIENPIVWSDDYASLLRILRF